MELNFACKQFPIEQVLRCSFGLSNAEFGVLRKLLSGGERSVEQLAASLNKDRTTVQRAVKPLIEKGLVIRRQYNLENGGYQFFYTAANKEAIKERIHEHFERFSRLVKEEIERW